MSYNSKSTYSSLLGVVLVHADSTEYYISSANSQLDVLSLVEFETRKTFSLSYSDFFFNYAPLLSFYKDDVDSTLYPLLNFESVMGL